jgi:hypothetical protein
MYPFLSFNYTGRELSKENRKNPRQFCKTPFVDGGSLSNERINPSRTGWWVNQDLPVMNKGKLVENRFVGKFMQPPGTREFDLGKVQKIPDLYREVGAKEQTDCRL